MNQQNPHKRLSREETRQAFGLTTKQATTPKIRKNNLEIERITTHKNKLVTFKLKQTAKESEWTTGLINEQQKKIDLLEKKNTFMKQQIKDSNSPHQPKMIEYDVDLAKAYPCRQILEEHHIDILNGKQFKLRNENTPSCYLYEHDNQNRWHDFGNDDGGDSIALYQKLNQSTFQEALKYLTQ